MLHEAAGKKSLTVFPAVLPGSAFSLDSEEATLPTVAQDRVNAGWTDLAGGADNFHTVIGHISNNFPRDNPASIDAVREVVILGHGLSVDDGQSAGLKFGESWENAETLRRIPTGEIAYAMADGATVDLQGCNVAATDTDKSLRWEVGRVTFGDGWGYIKAYADETQGQWYGISKKSVKGLDPEILKWPDDFPQSSDRTQKRGPRAP